MSAALREFCETCGAPEGECSCAWSSSRERESAVSDALGRPQREPAGPRDELRELGAHRVLVAGCWARMVREEDAYAVHFDDPRIPPFRARGLPSEVLEAAALHVRQSE